MATTQKKTGVCCTKTLGHKGQFGWNKNKKASQLTLHTNCHFPSLSNFQTFKKNFPTELICKTV